MLSPYQLKKKINNEKKEKEQQIEKILKNEHDVIERKNIEKNIVSGLLLLENNEEDRKTFIDTKQLISEKSFKNEFFGAMFFIMNKIYEDIINNNITKLETDKLFDLVSIEHEFNHFSGGTKEEIEQFRDIYNEFNGDNLLKEVVMNEITTKNILKLSNLLKKYCDNDFLVKEAINFLNNIDTNNLQTTQTAFSDLNENFNKFLNDQDNKGLKSAKDIATNDWFNNIDDIYHGKTLPKGLQLGEYKDLNSILMGLKEGQMITIGARPAVGKTAFALNLINETLNENLGHMPVIAFFSLEMNESEIIDRLASMNTGIDSNKLKNIKDLTNTEMDNLYLFSQQSLDGLYINDNPNITPAEIENQCNQLKNRYGYIDLIVVDYLQIISGGGFNENRQQEVSAISRKIKMIAKQLKVPFIVLAQLSRTSEQRQDKRPILSDIRESGSIEQDSDIVMFLYRDDYYSNEFQLNNQTEEEQQSKLQQEKQIMNRIGLEDNHKNDVSRLEVIISKNRSGRRGTVEYDFHKNISKFIELGEKEN